MAEKRKVRKDFDPTKEYSVDVSNCTKDEKKKVQQAFFDAGFPWEVEGRQYLGLDEAEQYSNTTADGHITKFCMFGWTAEECNMTAEEFLDLVYEPEQQGHVHAENMALYAEDAKTTDKPWELWQAFLLGSWVDLKSNSLWDSTCLYRRKPKTKLIHGVEIPDIGIDLSLTKERTDFYTPTIHSDEFFFGFSHHHEHNDCSYLSTLGITYPFTEEGRQAAVLHAKAMLGISPNSEN